MDAGAAERLWEAVVRRCVADVAAGAAGRTPYGCRERDGSAAEAVGSAEEFLRGTPRGGELLEAARAAAGRAGARRATRLAMSDAEFLAMCGELGFEEAAGRCGLTPSGARDRARRARMRESRGEGRRGCGPPPGDAELLAADTREKRAAIASRFGKSDKWAQRMRKEALARSRARGEGSR